MAKKLPRMNKLSKKIAKKTGLSMYEVDAILKVAAHDLVEILRKEQRFYWDGLGTFRVNIWDGGLNIHLRLTDDCYARLNKDNGEKADEIVFE